MAPTKSTPRLPASVPARLYRPEDVDHLLGATTVLDPACGSGNFLYMSLQLLLSREQEVIAFATQLGFKFNF